MTLTRCLAAAAALAPLITVAACGSGSSAAAVTPRSVTVQDRTDDAQHYVVDRATARVEDGQQIVAVTIRTIDDNGINIFLTATVSAPDGTSVTCQDDDPRHYASMSEPTDTVDLPCSSVLPDDAELTAVVTAG